MRREYLIVSISSSPGGIELSLLHIESLDTFVMGVCVMDGVLARDPVSERVPDIYHSTSANA